MYTVDKGYTFQMVRRVTLERDHCLGPAHQFHHFTAIHMLRGERATYQRWHDQQSDCPKTDDQRKHRQSARQISAEKDASGVPAGSGCLGTAKRRTLGVSAPGFPAMNVIFNAANLTAAEIASRLVCPT